MQLKLPIFLQDVEAVNLGLEGEVSKAPLCLYKKDVKMWRPNDPEKMTTIITTSDGSSIAIDVPFDFFNLFMSTPMQLDFTAVDKKTMASILSDEVPDINIDELLNFAGS